MKPRTGDGPLEVTKEGRGIVMRVPLEGGGRLVVELPTGTLPDDPDVFDGTTDLAHQVRGDDRLVPVLIPLGNGLLAAVKRGD